MTLARFLMVVTVMVVGVGVGVEVLDLLIMQTHSLACSLGGDIDLWFSSHGG